MSFRQACNGIIWAHCNLRLPCSSNSPASTGQLAELQPQDRAGARASWTPMLQRRRRRDTHFPICIFCCGCCHRSKCGMCCRT
uniref:Hepcidin antimicrobial peptide n=1 Tax=Macaca fascicularis TaxID=9541 RepID=A0A2K5WG79_MACFA